MNYAFFHVGHQCQFGDYQCRSGSCLNNGTCTVMNEGGYHCTCPSGLTGTRCEVDIDECASNPCQNKGNLFTIEIKSI